jgi:hypothetical protein
LVLLLLLVPRVDPGYVSAPSLRGENKGGTSQEECQAGSSADLDKCKPCAGNTWATKGSTSCTQCDTEAQPCAYASATKGACLAQGG